MSAGPAYVAMMVPGSRNEIYDGVSQYRQMAGFGVMLIDTPSDKNSISLGENGAAVINYTLSNADKVRMADAVADAVKVMFAGGAKRVSSKQRIDTSCKGSLRITCIYRFGTRCRADSCESEV